MTEFKFDLKTTDGMARLGEVTTAHGVIQTPVFMPVGTAATVKAMTVDDVWATGAMIILANTYHLMLRPGPERVERLGGVRKMMGWDGPLLTDSGGCLLGICAILTMMASPFARISMVQNIA
jgi:queuine tRNA-ribosyltransferase